MISRRILIPALFLALAAGLLGCSGQSGTPATQGSAAGTAFKIGIMTGTVSQGEEDFRAGEQVERKYPGRVKHVTYPDNFSTNLILPLGPERTRTVFEWFFREPERADVAAKVAQTVAFSDEIQREDIAVCEAVQRGLRSATYDRGRFSPKRETGVHASHRLWAGAMSAA